MTLDPKDLDKLRIDREPAALRYQAPKRRRGWLFAAAAVIVAVGGWMLFSNRGLEVSTVVAQGGNGTAGTGAVALNASGYVVARRIATVSSKVTGRVAEVLVEEGASVESGQLLARLDPLTAEAQTELARRQLDAARSALTEIEVRLAEAQRNLQRAESLRAQNLVSEVSLDAARAEVDALSARLGTQQSQRDVATAALALRQQDIEDLAIRAPFDGVVISKDAQPGEMVSPVSAGGGFTRTGIATIVDMDSREIEVDVNEAFINRVADDQQVEATLDAYPEWTIPARVINIVPAADRQKATVRVRIAFEQLDPRILPDMGIKVRLLEPVAETTSELRNTVAIPSEALQRDADRTYVWRVVDARVERVAVQAGAERSGRIEITAGVRAGDVLVAPLVEGLQHGMRVRVLEARP